MSVCQRARMTFSSGCNPVGKNATELPGLAVTCHLYVNHDTVPAQRGKKAFRGKKNPLPINKKSFQCFSEKSVIGSSMRAMN